VLDLLSLTSVLSSAKVIDLGLRHSLNWGWIARKMKQQA